MIHALGYSQTDFDAASPGRLCRGRERWIEPYGLTDSAPMQRLVITGSQFTDDSARDAFRGLPFSTVPLPAVIASLFPRKPLLAFMEDGHPADIPEEADGVEVYLGHRAGGRVEEPMVRWHTVVSGIREVRTLTGEDGVAETVRGFAVLNEPEDVTDELLDRLFLFVGMSTLDSPPAHYQPSALPEVLDRVKAVIVLHRDKHGPAIGVYSRERVQVDRRLQGLCDKHDALLVPFAIPPMLARWDRALYELRQDWMETRDDEFPVPPAAEPSSWEPRRRRRQKRRRSGGDDDEE